MAEEHEAPFTEGEEGGEEVGYKIPMNLRVDTEEEGTPEGDAPPDSREGVDLGGPKGEEAEAPPEGEFEITSESLFELGAADLDALIDQEELGVDKELSEKDKQIAIAKELGWDVAEETPEGPEGDAAYEAVKEQVLDLQRQVALLTPAQNLVMDLESDPVGALHKLAKHYGVKLDEGPGKDLGPDLKIDIPALSPGDNEDMPTYMARLVSAGLQSILPQLQRQVAPAPPAPHQQGGDPRVVKAIQFLDKHHPDWPQHQEKILDLLRVDPTLVSDPSKLYGKATGRTTTRAKATAKKVKLKRKGATGERGGRKPIRTVSKKVLDPSRDADFKEAWNRAKKAAERRK